MWSDFQAFKVAVGLLTSQVNTHNLLAFMEYLHANAQSKSNISNYMAAIRDFHIIYDLSTYCFSDEHMSLFLKFIQNSAPLTPKRTSLIDIPMPHVIFQQCDKMDNPLILGPCTSHVSFPFSDCPISYLRLLIHLISSGSWPQEQGGLLLVKDDSEL